MAGKASESKEAGVDGDATGSGEPERRTMRATTVRFGTDLWEMLEHEAAISGVSVAQYVRESALARLAFSAAKRGDASPWAHGVEPHAQLSPEELRAAVRDESEAVLAQSRQTLRETARIRKQYSRGG